MRPDKQSVQHDKKQRADAHHDALLKRAQALPVAAHSTSERLSSNPRVQEAEFPWTRHCKLSPLVASNRGCPLTVYCLISRSNWKSCCTSVDGAVPRRLRRLPSLKIMLSSVTFSGSFLAVVSQHSREAYLRSWRSLSTW